MPVKLSDETVTIILSEPMVRVIDVFRDIDQNFVSDATLLIEDVSRYGSLSHLFANGLARADDEIVEAVLRLHRSCIGESSRHLIFKPLGSPLASADEITLLILLSAAQNGRFGLAGEAVLRLGCRESLESLRAAYAFANWLKDSGIEIGPVDPRLMQQRPVELAESMIETCLERLEFRTASARASGDYVKLIGR